MARKGVKPGTKRGPYKRKDAAGKAEARERRVQEAEILLPQYLITEWSVDWKSRDLLEKVFLMAFSGLSVAEGAKMLRIEENEFLRALKAFPEVSHQWSRGQEEVVTLCHIALTQRIRGMKVTEIRRTEKADGGVDVTTITKELPPDIDAVKFFLNKRVAQYQESNGSDQFETRLDTMLGKLEQMDLFG